MELAPDRLATLVSSIGTAQFGRALLEVFSPRYGIVHGIAFEQETGAAPRVLLASAHNASENAATSDLVRSWTAHDHQHDPVLGSLEALASPHIATRYCDARDFGGQPRHDQFIERYYGHHGLGEEVDFWVRDGGKLQVLSLCKRRGEGFFTGDERHHVAQLAPLMLACVRQHSQRLPPTPTDSPQLAQDWTAARALKLARVRAAMHSAPCGLTPREADICAHMVMGYAAEAIGLCLGIATQTVASHRKRAYAKLGVSCQTELFAVWHRFADGR